jgi:phage terminase large subunit-like protein
MPFEVWRPQLEESRRDPEFPPGTRVFVPATHADNPALLKRDPGYISRIRAISNRGLRLAMEKGDWDAIDAVEGALWQASELDQGRVSPTWFKNKVRSYKRVLAVDPSDGASDGERGGDEYGVVLCAKGADGVGYVEASWAWKLPVSQMARQSINLYHEFGCAELVIERNHGGKWMVEVFRQVDDSVNIAEVWASDGKRTRAEPVAPLFSPDLERGLDRIFLARMVGFHPELEEELTGTIFEPGSISPNRLDAMVWGMSRLMLGQRTVKEAQQGRDLRLAGRR